MDKLLSMTSSSFVDLLKAHAPDLLPWRRGGAPAGMEVPHGTTIAAATYAGGVLIAGDRRATQGNLIAGRDVDKLSITDDYSAVGFAGTVGISLEMARLFEMEIMHYEKIEGVPLSLAGKVNRLGAMIKGNLEMATAGMVSLPLFVGYDLEAAAGRVFSFDPIGACYEEREGYGSIGSGSPYARSSLKKRYDADAGETATLTALVEALYDAAEEDTATGGPDMMRNIYPTAIRITADGATRLAEEEIAVVAATIDPPWTPPSSSGSP